MQCAERTASVAGLELPSLFNGFVGSCGLHINPSTEFYVKKATSDSACVAWSVCRLPTANGPLDQAPHMWKIICLKINPERMEQK